MTPSQTTIDELVRFILWFYVTSLGSYRPKKGNLRRNTLILRLLIEICTRSRRLTLVRSVLGAAHDIPSAHSSNKPWGPLRNLLEIQGISCMSQLISS